MKRSINKVSANQKRHKKAGEIERNNTLTELSTFLDGLCFFILNTGSITKLRCKLFTEQILKCGGKVTGEVSEETNYVIVDDSIDWDLFSRITKWNQVANKRCKPLVVRSAWLSGCFKDKTLHNAESYILQAKENNGLTSETNVEEKLSQNINQDKKGISTSFACSKPSSSVCTNVNKHITDKLELLAETYKNTKDHWREFGYTKAINALKKSPKKIKTYNEAKALPGIGERLAEKIWEIVESGELRKLNEVNSEDQIKAINIFAQIWGAGPTTAEMWAQRGFRTLEDLSKKATLNKQQEIGLKHYHDFLEKIPRKEASEIVTMVKGVALSLQFDLEIIGCGSYRRGRAFCGDVDILIASLKSEIIDHFLPKLISALHDKGLLTDNLSMPDPKTNDRGKYMGVCKLPGPNNKYRRIDLFVVPSEEFATALLAYTGSGHFNRSMRLLARKKGMALSDQALTSGVIRKGTEKIHGGQKLETPTEESIFKLLGLEFRTPAERDH